MKEKLKKGKFTQSEREVFVGKVEAREKILFGEQNAHTQNVCSCEERDDLDDRLAEM